MRRVLLSLAVALGLTAGMSLPVSATVEVDISIDCDDGDSIPLTVDLDTLSALTASVQAINENPAGPSCTLTQLSAPAPVVRFGSAADAAMSGAYVIGAGSVNVGCSDDFSHLFVGYFSVKIWTKNGSLTGSANLKVPDGQCVAAGQLWSKPTCLAIVPTTIGARRAWANSLVTKTTGSFFAPQMGKTIGWAFEDNGPNGGTVTKDRWRVEEKPGSCPLYGDPATDYYTLLTGDVTVQP